jgi:opacity protein-like surface antigen
MPSLPSRLVLALVLLVAFPAAPARAADPPAFGDWDFGLQAGYLFGVTNNSQAVTFMPRAGRLVWVSESETPGVVSFGIEGIFTHFYETNSAMELGGGPYLRWRWVRPWLQPYAEVGVGMLYNDLKNFSLSSRVLFSVNGAVGVEIPVTERVGVTTGYRFRHISNAGQDEVNPGLNTNIICAGVTFTY